MLRRGAVTTFNVFRTQVAYSSFWKGGKFSIKYLLLSEVKEELKKREIPANQIPMERDFLIAEIEKDIASEKLTNQQAVELINLWDLHDIMRKNNIPITGGGKACRETFLNFIEKENNVVKFLGKWKFPKKEKSKILKPRFMNFPI